MKLPTKVATAFDRIVDSLAVLAAFSIFTLMVLISGEIAWRSLLGRSHVWVIEICTYLLVLMTFLGATWVLKVEGHVKMDLLVNHLKPRTQGLVNVVISIMCAITSFVIGWWGVVVSWLFNQGDVHTAGAVVIPRAPWMLILSLGFFLLFIQFLRRAYAHLRMWRVSPTEAKKQSMPTIKINL